MNPEKLNIPSAEEMERLKKQNKAYFEGIKELDNMHSVSEEEKNEARETITDNVQENFEKQQGKERNELADEVNKRAEKASEKIKQRVHEQFITDIHRNGDRAEFELRKLRNDFYHLAKDPNDDCGGGNYEGWTPDEIKELYFVLYNEKL